ncbi:MAG TPA: NAD(P)H-dependent glycerol-3-phosphate dehydrogenase [Burkholderiales bacterium]|nr:NAD(P)H-dependent glycerol-3-phosphate dehydrogenase [Burkholderiales bacterium]
MHIAVLGAGAWGTGLAIHLCRRLEVTLWARDAELCSAMRSTRINERYLPRITLPDALRITDDLAAALAAADLILIAVPTVGLREMLQHLQRAQCHTALVWLCKGFEPGQAKLPHQVFAEELPAGTVSGVLSGPSFAEEVARGLPTAVTLASTRIEFARTTARALHGGSLRVYSGDDVIGVEVAGALKNVMAIAAGICDGLALGQNARAALITRGLAEIIRLGTRLGGRAETFMGLAGAGDLILTCTGDLSRNRRVGVSLGQGRSLAATLQQLGHVAEGVNTAREVRRLARELGVEMPITDAVCRVLDDHRAAGAVVQELLQREPKPEN